MTDPTPEAAHPQDELTRLLESLAVKGMSISRPDGRPYITLDFDKAEAALLAYVDRQRAEAVKVKDNAYWERDQLVAALSKLYPAWLGYHDGEWEDYWRTIVYINLPTGQVSWHIHDSEKGFFAHLDPGLEEWDGHDTKEKYRRLRSLGADSQEGADGQ